MSGQIASAPTESPNLVSHLFCFSENQFLFPRSHAGYKVSYFNEGHGHRVGINGRVVPLAGQIDHDDRKPLTRWIAEQDRYAAIEASHLLTSPLAGLSLQDRLRRKVLSRRACRRFTFCWLVDILDGWPGWNYVLQRTIAEALLSLRLLIEKHLLNPTILLSK